MKTRLKGMASVQPGKGKDLSKVFLSPVFCAALAAVLLAPLASAKAGSVHRDVPEAIDTKAKYLFYMHGLAIEQGGERARAYKYDEILDELAKRDFVVIGEKRSRVKNNEYAEKVVKQVKKLLAAGVPAASITVAGHSKGGMMTLMVMSRLREPDISYVNFAGCGKETSGFSGYLDFAAQGAKSARGRLLSAYDRSDRIAGSCREALDVMTGAEVTERVLEFGGGHELFYRPENGWIEVLVQWANREK